MEIIMNEQQYQELENWVEITDGMYFEDGEKKEEVECFSLIKEIVDCKYDTNDIPKRTKRKMQKQLILLFEWVESIVVNVKLEYKDQFLSYFCDDIER